MLQLFVFTGLLFFPPVSVLGAENVGSNSGLPLQQGKVEDLFAQGITQVTGVEVIQIEEGLKLILKTVAGSERLVPLIVPEGNDLVIDLLDATLGFSIRDGVTELNPAPGIDKITVNKNNENSIRVRIAGAKQTPSAEVVPGRDNLILSITPQSTTAGQEPDEVEANGRSPVQIIYTGEGE